MAEHRTTRTALAGVAAVAAFTIGGCSQGAQIPTESQSAPKLAGVSDVKRVGKITGADSPSRTDRYAAGYMDLGSMFEYEGKVWFAFGDTFGVRPANATGGGGSFWRSNVMGYTSDADPSDGITLDGMIVDGTNSAKELLSSEKVDGKEMTVIPTHGFAANGAMYLHWMSVKRWGEPGEWEVNRAGLAKSTDDGKRWTKLKSPSWSGTSGFVQISPFRVTEDGVSRLYVWGITHGRFGGVSLARVDEKDVEDASAWQYFSGTADRPAWSGDISRAAIVLDDTVGELSVVWNTYLGGWIMTYLKEGTGIVIRTAATPWGPWSKATTLVSQDDVPGLYAPFMLPKYTTDGGRTIYFTLSVWDPYNVFWYRATLDKG